MRRADRASLRKIQSVLEDPKTSDRDARNLARVGVAGLLARLEARRLLADMAACRRENLPPKM